MKITDEMQKQQSAQNERRRIVNFWDNYSRLCTEAGKSPSAVASDAGISVSAVVRWKAGATPRNSVLVKLANTLGVPVGEFFSNYEEPSNKSGDGYSEIAAILKACEGLSDNELREALHYIEFLKTKR